MGGYGSGWHRGARQTVNDALTYTLGTLRPHIETAERMCDAGRTGVAADGTCTWTWSGGQTSRVGFSLRVECLSGTEERGLILVLDYTADGEPVTMRVPLDTTTAFRGVARYWMRCPACGRRCGKLHLPRGAQRFACRTCHDLTYTSCQESRKFDSLYRGIAKQMGTNPATIKRLLNSRGSG